MWTVGKSEFIKNQENLFIIKNGFAKCETKNPIKAINYFTELIKIELREKLFSFCEENNLNKALGCKNLIGDCSNCEHQGQEDYFCLYFEGKEKAAVVLED